MENGDMTLEDLVQTFIPQVKNEAWKIMGKYSGWFEDSREEVKDLVSTAVLGLVEIYPDLDFTNPGWKGFVHNKIRWSLQNYVNKNIPAFSEPVYEEETGSEKQKWFSKVASMEDLHEIIPDSHDEELEIEAVLFKRDVSHLLTEFMETLTVQERFMIFARFVDKKSFAAIGEVFGIYRETVSTKIESILKKLKRFLWQKRSWSLELGDIEDYLKETDIKWLIISRDDP